MKIYEIERRSGIKTKHIPVQWDRKNVEEFPMTAMLKRRMREHIDSIDLR